MFQGWNPLAGTRTHYRSLCLSLLLTCLLSLISSSPAHAQYFPLPFGKLTSWPEANRVSTGAYQSCFYDEISERETISELLILELGSCRHIVCQFDIHSDGSIFLIACLVKHYTLKDQNYLLIRGGLSSYQHTEQTSNQSSTTDYDLVKCLLDALTLNSTPLVKLRWLNLSRYFDETTSHKETPPPLPPSSSPPKWGKPIWFEEGRGYQPSSDSLLTYYSFTPNTQVLLKYAKANNLSYTWETFIFTKMIRFTERDAQTELLYYYALRAASRDVSQWPQLHRIDSGDIIISKHSLKPLPLTYQLALYRASHAYYLKAVMPVISTLTGRKPAPPAQAS